MNNKQESLMEILLINGPNLNMLGKRDPEIYGTDTLESIQENLRKQANSLDVKLTCFQSNHEGMLIDEIQSAFVDGVDGVIINPGGLTHTSVSLRDALDILTCPIVEVHLSDIKKRESFRQISLIEDIVTKSISGAGASGYSQALDFIYNYIREKV